MLTVKLQKPRINFARYRDLLHTQLSELIAQAGMKWIEATAEKIPVWSGASRGTFNPLASYVGYVLTIGQADGAPNRVGLGEAMSAATFEANRDTGIYSFSYMTTLTHLIVNEYHDARQWGFNLRQPGPYHFQEAGQEAFKNAVRDATLPDWRRCLTVEQVNIG